MLVPTPSPDVPVPKADGLVPWTAKRAKEKHLDERVKCDQVQNN